MTARQVILLRHGLTDYNRDGRFQGQADVPLNAVGLEQAQRAAERLRDLDITSIVSSDLLRASTTAQTIAAQLGLPVTLDPRLQEVNVGSWAGLTVEEAQTADPALWAQRLAGEDVTHSASGETATDAGRRVAAAVAEYAEAAGDDEVLLFVGHGFTTRVASLLLVGLDYSHVSAFAGLGNCHWVVLRPQAGPWRLIGYNRT